MKVRTRRIEEMAWALGIPKLGLSIVRLAHRNGTHDAMCGFYQSLLPSKALVFDIGANRGEFCSVFQSLGATVVAVEPNPDCARHIQLAYDGVTTVNAAVGAEGGLCTLNVSDAIDCISSVSEDWIASMKKASPKYAGMWARKITVPMVTLDSLIKHFGVPDYIKIDIEGFEEFALRGLHTQPGLLSFEFNCAFPEATMRCLDTFAPGSTFNYAMLDPVHFELPEWVGQATLKERLAQLPQQEMNGDIYVGA